MHIHGVFHTGDDLTMTPAKAGKTARRDSVSSLLRRLPLKKQEVIRPVLEQPREHVLLSLRDMAEILHSAPATLLRIVRDLGFASYYNFRQYLHELALSQTTSLNELASESRGFGQLSLNQDAKNLQALRNTLDEDRLLALIKRMYKAERILVIGGDMAANLVGLLNYQMSLLGLNCSFAISTGEILHRARRLGRRDLLFAISFRRGLRQTIEGLKIAHTKGAYCVGITDTSVSPIARYANEFFVTPTEGVSFACSYVAATAFINVLMSECANHHRARTLAILKETAEEQQSGFRWYVQE
jgi:DNA-binding MurR/RpiR family transcriptional regulator